MHSKLKQIQLKKKKGVTNWINPRKISVQKTQNLALENTGTVKQGKSIEYLKRGAQSQKTLKLEGKREKEGAPGTQPLGPWAPKTKWVCN